MMLALLAGCSGSQGSAPTTAPLPATRTSPTLAPSPPAVAEPPGAALTLRRVDPADGSLVQAQFSLRLEFDRPLDPATVPGALSFEYPDPGVTFLAEPFRHVALRLADGGRTIIAEPPELLVGRAIRVMVSDSLRGADGAAPAPAASSEFARELHYQVMELPP